MHKDRVLKFRSLLSLLKIKDSYSRLPAKGSAKEQVEEMLREVEKEIKFRIDQN